MLASHLFFRQALAMPLLPGSSCCESHPPATSTAQPPACSLSNVTAPSFQTCSLPATVAENELLSLLNPRRALRPRGFGRRRVRDSCPRSRAPRLQVSYQSHRFLRRELLARERVEGVRGCDDARHAARVTIILTCLSDAGRLQGFDQCVATFRMIAATPGTANSGPRHTMHWPFYAARSLAKALSRRVLAIVRH